jgi:hypothetical protein
MPGQNETRYARCDNPKLNHQPFYSFEADAAVPENMDGHPWIETGPDFGCIHFTQKP